MSSTRYSTRGGCIKRVARPSTCDSTQVGDETTEGPRLNESPADSIGGLSDFDAINDHDMLDHMSDADFEDANEQIVTDGFLGSKRPILIDPISGLEILRISDSSSSFLEISAPRAVTKIMKGFLGGPFIKWDDVEEHIKDGLWDKFREKYVWPDHTDEQVKRVWINESMEWLSEMMYDARRSTKMKSGQRLVEWKMLTMKNVNLINLHGWVRIFGMLAVISSTIQNGEKKKSKSNAKNKKSSKYEEISKHTGGSVSAAIHEDRWENYRAGVEEKHGSNQSTKLDFYDKEVWVEGT